MHACGAPRLAYTQASRAAVRCAVVAGLRRRSVQLCMAVRVLDGGTGHELKRRGFGEDACFAHSFMAGLLANEQRP